MVFCEMVTWHNHTLLIGMYLPPLMLEHLPDFKEALQQFKGLDHILFGGFNMDLDNARNLRIQCMADLLSEYGLIDLVRHFQQFC